MGSVALLLFLAVQVTSPESREGTGQRPWFRNADGAAAEHVVK